MKISEAGIRYIAIEEGCVLHVYPDSKGNPTIGIGHLVKHGESFPKLITRAEAYELFRRDLVDVEAAINRQVTAQISQNAYDALCSFLFNEGSGALHGSHLLAAINDGRTADIAAAFAMWDKGDPILHARRNREATLCLTPDEVDPAATTDPAPPPIDLGAVVALQDQVTRETVGDALEEARDERARPETD